MRECGGVIELECLPRQSVSFELPLTEASGDSYINIYVKFGSDTVSEEQLILSQTSFELANIEENSSINLLKIDKKSSKEYLVVEFNGGFLRLNQRNGEVEEYNAFGTEYMLNTAQAKYGRGFLPHIARAPIDNDKYLLSAWGKQGLLESEFSLVSQKAKVLERHIQVVSEFSHTNGLALRFRCTRTIDVYSDGRLDFNFTLKNRLPFARYKLPRFGVRFVMPKTFSETEYFGTGEHEALADFSEHVRLGIYKVKVGDFEERHIKPQESGSRLGTRFVRFTNNKTKAALLIEAKNAPMYFKASNNFTEDFAKAKHQEDLPRRELTAVSIDAYLRAAGSASCGPAPFAPHDTQFGGSPLQFDFRIMPKRGD
jgi:beta-galactosidase